MNQSATTTAPSRAGKGQMGGHYDKAAIRAFKALAAELGTTMENLIAIGANQVLQQHGKPPAFEVKPIED